MTFDKEFKEALSRIPSKEKDKLVLRLLKKDLVLANRLYFELVDNRTVDDRREHIEGYLRQRIHANTSYVFKSGYIMMDLRELSGAITEHVRITKDTYGELSLTLMVLVETLENRNQEIAKETRGRSGKLCVYIIAKAFKILIVINKMHEDIRMEFEDYLIKLGQLFSVNKNIMNAAIYNGFDVNWLLQATIPEDIEAIHKAIRAKGYLKGGSY
jgi:hypothetical protein